MNLNANELDDKFTDFLNRIFLESEELTLTSLIEKLESFLPDANCCLLLLYKYAGSRILCQQQKQLPLRPNLNERDNSAIREFVPETKVTDTPQCMPLPVLSAVNIEPEQMESWPEISQKQEGIGSIKKTISPKKLIKRIAKILENGNTYLTECEISEIYDKSIKPESNKFGASLAEDIHVNGFSSLTAFVRAVEDPLDVQIKLLTHFTSSAEAEYFYIRPELVVDDNDPIDRIAYWELSEANRNQITLSLRAERDEVYSALREYEGVGIDEISLPNQQYRSTIHRHHLDTYGQLIDTYPDESTVTIVNNVLCIRDGNDVEAPGDGFSPQNSLDQVELISVTFQPAKSFISQSDNPRMVEQFTRHAYNFEFYFVPNSAVVNSKQMQITLKLILRTPTEVEEERRQIESYYTHQSILDASELGKSTLGRMMDKTPVVIVSGDHKYCRGEIRVFNSMQSIRVELVDSEDCDRVKTFAHSELRLLDEKFNRESDLLDMIIDGLKWPVDEVDEPTIFQIIKTFFDRSMEPITTTGDIYSKKTGEMFITNIKCDKKPNETLEDRLANFACFGKCQSSYERAMQIKERSKDRSALQKSERPGRTDRPAYMNILADFQKQTNTQLQDLKTVNQMDFAKITKENLPPPSDEPEAAVKDDTVSSVDEVFGDTLPSNSTQCCAENQINDKYENETMRTIWDESDTVLDGGSNVIIANSRLSQSQEIVSTVIRPEDSELGDDDEVLSQLPSLDGDSNHHVVGTESMRTESVTSTSTKGSRKNRSALKMIRKINKKNNEKSK